MRGRRDGQFHLETPCLRFVNAGVRLRPVEDTWGRFDVLPPDRQVDAHQAPIGDHVGGNRVVGLAHPVAPPRKQGRLRPAHARNDEPGQQYEDYHATHVPTPCHGKKIARDWLSSWLFWRRMSTVRLLRSRKST